MGFDQYHEPPEELPAATRTFARLCASLTEEAEAIGWYEQRLAVEKDRQARAIMKNAQHEEMKHFGMDLEFLLRKKPQWREVLQGILFTKGDIVELGDEAEKELAEFKRLDEGNRHGATPMMNPAKDGESLPPLPVVAAGDSAKPRTPKD